MEDNKQLVPVSPKNLLVQENDIQITVPISYQWVDQSYYSFTRKVTDNCTVRMDEYDHDAHEDDVAAEFDETVPDSKKSYYLFAAASGLFSASLTFLKLNDISEGIERIKEKDLQKYLIAAARVAGCKKHDFKGCLQFVLDKAIPFVEDRVPSGTADSVRSYLNALSSNPRVVGLVFSIITQFTSKRYIVEKGKMVSEDLPDYYVIGCDAANKVFYGFLYWVFALAVDVSLSKKPLLDELRIPKELIQLLREVVNLPFMKKIVEDLPKNEEEYSAWLSKTMERSIIPDLEGETSQFNLLSVIKEIAVSSINDSIPVLINECLFRGFYMLKNLTKAAASGKISSFAELDQLNPWEFLPYNNQVVSQMAVIASGTFLAADLASSTVRAIKKMRKADGKKFLGTLLTEISFAGLGRFVIAVGVDSKYWSERFKVVFVRSGGASDNEDYIPFEEGSSQASVYDVLSLDAKQARLLYSLESLAVDYDIKNTKNLKDVEIKRKWQEEWQAALLKSLNYKEDDFFERDENILYDYFYMQAKVKDNWRWIYLIALEMALFQAYHPIGSELDKQYKKLKVRKDYVSDKFAVRQTVVSKSQLENMKSLYKKYHGMISGSTQNRIIGIGVTAAAAIATGGLALTFAPEIAAVIAGEAVVGLHGAALTSASLAFVGGGAVAAGGAGVAGGTAIITGGGALIGLASSGTAAMATVMSQTNPEYWVRQGAKLVTFSKVALLDRLHDLKALNAVYTEVENALKNTEQMLEELENGKCSLDKEMIEKIKDYQKCLQRTSNELRKTAE